MDQIHPLVRWLTENRMTRFTASLAIGRSPACVSRWIRGEREPDVIDQEKIAALTEGEVPERYWREQAVARAMDEAA